MIHIIFIKFQYSTKFHYIVLYIPSRRVFKHIYDNVLHWHTTFSFFIHSTSISKTASEYWNENSDTVTLFKELFNKKFSLSKNRKFLVKLTRRISLYHNFAYSIQQSSNRTTQNKSTVRDIYKNDLSKNFSLKNSLSKNRKFLIKLTRRISLYHNFAYSI